MDPVTFTTSIATLLKNIVDVLGPTDIVGHDNDPELGDLVILAAFYRDVNYLVLSSSHPPTFSIVQALLRCQSTQRELLDLLRDIGYGRIKRSPKGRDRMRYAVNLYLKRGKLSRAQKAHREAVLLLRDIAME